MQERLSKWLSIAGVASRREADGIVREGRVTVNGATVQEPGQHVDPEKDHIKVDGKLLGKPPPPVYILINKPKGVLSTPRDPEGRVTVSDHIRGVKGRLLPISRLEADDEGLQLLTTDYVLAAKLNQPEAGIPRTYLLKVRGIPDEATLARLRSGVPLEGGRTLPMEVRMLSVTDRNAWLQVTYQEARAHVLRWALMKLRFPVVKSRRTAFGPLTVRGIPPGAFRILTQDEVKRLLELAESPPGLPASLPPESRETAAKHPDSKQRRVRRKLSSPRGKRPQPSAERSK